MNKKNSPQRKTTLKWNSDGELSEIDMLRILEKISNKIFLNEINTTPGFTSKSMFPMLWNASGLNIDQLVAQLIDISSDS